MTGVFAQIIIISLLWSADASFSVQSNFALSFYRDGRIFKTRKVIHSHSNLNLIQCLSSCLKTPRCMSFNFGKNTCQLLRTHLCEEFGNHLTPKPEFSYYDLAVNDLDEQEGILWKTPYCKLEGLCSRQCESIVPMNVLNSFCQKDIDCQLGSGERSLCREETCKCEDGYWIQNITYCDQVPNPGYLRLDTKYYMLSNNRLNFRDAEEACKKDGSFLVKIEDKKTNEFVVNLMKKQRVKMIWIGLTDDRSEGRWVWRDGSELQNNEFWDEKEPNNLGDAENCGEITNNLDYHWNDAKCHLLQNYVCQFHGEN